MKFVDTLKNRRMIEVFLVVVSISIICVILFPALIKIFNYSLKSSAEDNTDSALHFTKQLYATLSIYDDVPLPFRVEFKEDGYTIYSNNIEYKPTTPLTVESKRKLPKTGIVEIDINGMVTAKEIKFKLGNYVCSQFDGSKPLCVKQQNSL
ncbi:MAG: hypothetical protein IKF01_03880 [Bacilli bacterium]|nr:hypothetical protein [Bacilli bacterium]